MTANEVDYETQENNISRNHIVGDKTIGQLASEASMNYRILHNTILRCGMSLKEAKELLAYNPKKDNTETIEDFRNAMEE